MPTKTITQRAKDASSKPTLLTIADVHAHLQRLATPKTRDSMARYGLPSDNAIGVAVRDIQKVAKTIGRDHVLAEQLWKTETYEARMLCAYIEDPEQVTPAQMDRWCRDFDNWAIVDTICFALFDRTPHAFDMIVRWSKRKPEFQRRAAFALLACVALHDRVTTDESFSQCLPLIEKAAIDDRNFVKKGVSWALRSVGRRSKQLHTESMALARRLAGSANAAARWIGKDALKDLAKPQVVKRLKRKPANFSVTTVSVGIIREMQP